MATFWESVSRLRKELIPGQNLWWLELGGLLTLLCKNEQPAAAVFFVRDTVLSMAYSEYTYGSAWHWTLTQKAEYDQSLLSSFQPPGEVEQPAFLLLSRHCWLLDCQNCCSPLWMMAFGALQRLRIGLVLWMTLIPHWEIYLPTAIGVYIEGTSLPTGPTYVWKSLSSRSLLHLPQTLLARIIRSRSSQLQPEAGANLYECIRGWSSWQGILFPFTFLLKGNLMEILFSLVNC